MGGASMSGIAKFTVEERLSHVSARLNEITTLVQRSSKSADAIVAELQCEIENIYLLIGDENDVNKEGRGSDG